MAWVLDLMFQLKELLMKSKSTNRPTHSEKTGKSIAESPLSESLQHLLSGQKDQTGETSNFVIEPLFRSKSIVRIICLVIVMMLIIANSFGQSCTPQGDQTSFGSNGVWTGYVYQGMNFNTYKGYVSEGKAGNPNFDESFGGAQVNYNTHGCSVLTDTFSVRYKLTQTFTNANYTFTVGGDDGFRLSLDGGATWFINQWVDQSYATTSKSITLNGTYNLVLEYYDHFIDNRLTFNVVTACAGSGDPSVYGTNNVWKGYIYTGMNFNYYAGWVTEGTAKNPNFDEGFGGDIVNYPTSDCPVTTTQFSARYRLQQTFSNAKYVFTIGGDDGYRLSLDGGNTWVINMWKDQAYTISSYTVQLNGTYNMVLEYYENTGANRITFNVSSGILPLKLLQFTGNKVSANDVLLHWETTAEVNTDHFTIQRSSDGANFQNIGIVSAKGNISSGEVLNYSYTDLSSQQGIASYRLEMTDIDGASTYSSVIQLSEAKSSEQYKIYPTVVQHTNLFISLSSPLNAVKVELFDLSGRKLRENNLPTINGTQVLLSASNFGELTNGMYLVHLSAEGQTILNKMIIVQGH